MEIPDFLTHYYEEDRGPFRNVCDLTDAELQELVEQEQGAVTSFNRFSLGPEFWKVRRLADDFLITAYAEKFGRQPVQRPFYAVLGRFDRTLAMYRKGASIQLPLNAFKAEDVTFAYPDHFCFAYRSCSELRPTWYIPESFHGQLWALEELPAAIEKFGLDRQMEASLLQDRWVCSYIEAHIWCAMSTQRVFLVPYDPQWAKEFDRESSTVASVLGNRLVAIHHIGSTAIPNISAKPIIDMLAVADDLSALDEKGPQLESLGYEVMGEFGISGRRYYRKNDIEGNRTHQIHAFQTGSPQIQRHLAFRDYLKAHPEQATRYTALKQNLALLNPLDISSYTDGKHAFISEIDTLAAVWAKTNRAD